MICAQIMPDIRDNTEPTWVPGGSPVSPARGGGGRREAPWDGNDTASPSDKPQRSKTAKTRSSFQFQDEGGRHKVELSAGDDGKVSFSDSYSTAVKTSPRSPGRSGGDTPRSSGSAGDDDLDGEFYEKLTQLKVRAAAGQTGRREGWHDEESSHSSHIVATKQ